MGKGQVKSAPTKTANRGSGSGSGAGTRTPKGRDNSVMQDALAQKAPALDEGAAGLFADFERYQPDYGSSFAKAFGLIGKAQSAQDSGDVPGFHGAVDAMLDEKTGILLQLDWYMPHMGVYQQISDYLDGNPELAKVEEFRSGFLRVAGFCGIVKSQRNLLIPFLVPHTVHGKGFPNIPSIDLGNLSYTEGVEAQVGTIAPMLDVATEIRTLLAGAATAKGAQASAIATDIVAGPMSDYMPGSGEFEYLYLAVKNSKASTETKARVDWLLGRDDFAQYETLFGVSLMVSEMGTVAGEVRQGAAIPVEPAAPAAQIVAVTPGADTAAGTRAGGKAAGGRDFDSSKMPKTGGKGEEDSGSYASERGMNRTQTTREAEGKIVAGDGKVGGEAAARQTTKRRDGSGSQAGVEGTIEAGSTLSGSGKVTGSRTGANGNTTAGGAGAGREADGTWSGNADATRTRKNGDGSSTSTNGGLAVSEKGKVTATGGRTVEDANGNKKGTSGSGGYDAESGEASASFKRSNTDKDGKDLGSAGGSGSLDLDGADGKRGGKAELSASKGKKSVALSGGYTITVNKPEKVDGRWVITYETELAGKISGGVKSKKAGASANIGGSKKKSGRKSFASEKEAQAFFDAPTLEGVPSSASDVRAMGEGDERGKESSFDAGVDGSVSLGAVEVGAGGSHSSSDYETLTKGKGGKVRMEVGHKELDEVHGSVGMAGVSAGAGKSWASQQSVTVEFDLDTDDGRRAYNHYQRFHALPRGARGWKVVGSAKGSAETDSYSLGLLGVKVGSSHTVASSVERADGNKYERDSGTDSTSVSVPLLGNYSRSHRLSMLQVNDGRSFFNTESTVKASDLDDVRSGMARSAMETEKGIGGSNKGTYRLQSAISEADMDKFIQVATSANASKMFNWHGGLHATDGLEDLQNGLMRARGDKDTQRRVLARWVADEGYDALTTLHAISHGKFDQNGAGGTQMFVAIDGDPLMTGMKGQLELELRIQGWDQRLQKGERGPALASEIRKDIGFQRQKARHLEECGELPARVYSQEYDRIRSNVTILDSVLQRALTGDGAATTNAATGLEGPRFIAFRRACANLSVARGECEKNYEWAYKEYRINEKGAFQSGRRRAESMPHERKSFDQALDLYEKGNVARQAALLAESLSSQTLDERSVAPLTAIVTKARAEYLRGQRFYKSSSDLYFEIHSRNIGKGPYIQPHGRVTPGQ
ncbi:MAG: hypothetical protein Q8P41_19070 [Pseudomonadota bacterium]|nr:hypothetical protein [Pseudomonadota bacterium]